MANNKLNPATSPLSFNDFKNTGFYSSGNLAALQQTLANYNMSDDQARQQAIAQYKPELDMQRTQFENQLAELNINRDSDINKLNSQYNKTLNAIMSNLNSRNLGRSSLVATRGVENENARNSAISETSLGYLRQANEVNANLRNAESNYAQNVENRALELKRENDAQRIQLMTQIAQLQQNGYSAYASYLSNLDNLSVDQQRLENERYQSQLYQQKLDNDKLSFKNDETKLANERLAYKNDEAKLANERLSLENEKQKLANEKYSYEITKKNS